MAQEVGTEALCSGLTAAQRHAVVTEAAPLCILAGAGTGKTRVLTRRIAYRIAAGTADADHVLALTFTRKAAGELGDRLRALGVRSRLTSGTFHAVAYAQLRRYWADRGEQAPQLLDRKARLLGQLVSGRPHLAGAGLRDLAAEIEWAQARLVTPDQYPGAATAAGRRAPVPVEALSALYARYEVEKRRRRLADFDDLLSHCATAFEHDPSFAAAERWRWRHVFVDEFQDVNPLQHRLLVAWLAGRVDLCVVGDTNQAVYGWNGSDPTLLSSVAARWPGTEVVHLDDNHRCTPQVVAAAAGVLGPASSMRSSRPDGPPPAIRAYPSDRAEAHGVAAEIRQARGSGLAWSHLAVLVRTNAQMGVFEAAFRAAQVPYRVAGTRPVLDDPDVQAELAALGPRRSEPLAMVVADLRDRAERADRAGAQPPSGPTGRRTALATLTGLAADFQRLDPHGDIDGFLGWLGPATNRDRMEAPGDAVTLCTFHRAKGLEWLGVWVTGLEDGLVPIGHATTTEADDEERRLLYVALTRAGRDLHCSWSENRDFGGRLVPRRPSPWLAAIEASIGCGAAGPTAGSEPSWRDQLAVQRGRLAGCRRPGSVRPGGAPAQGDPAVVDALRAWRANAARAAGVPAQVLLHDATMAAIAVIRPGTPEDLLAVPGLGQVQVARYGTMLLDLVAQHRATA